MIRGFIAVTLYGAILLTMPACTVPSPGDESSPVPSSSASSTPTESSKSFNGTFKVKDRLGFVYQVSYSIEIDLASLYLNILNAAPGNADVIGGSVTGEVTVKNLDTGRNTVFLYPLSLGGLYPQGSPMCKFTQSSVVLAQPAGTFCAKGFSAEGKQLDLAPNGEARYDWLTQPIYTKDNGPLGIVDLSEEQAKSFLATAASPFTWYLMASDGGSVLIACQKLHATSVPITC